MKARKLRRIAILFTLLAVIGYAFIWFMDKGTTFVVPRDTAGYIAAIRNTATGAQVVAITPDGTINESEDFVEGKTDRDIAWDPKGNRVFFISDRKDDSFHIYRWDPVKNHKPDQKSIDRASRNDLTFDVQEDRNDKFSALVVVRGTVQEFLPDNAESHQILPPNYKALQTDPEGGTGSTFELIYKRYGKSFRLARWFQNRRYTAAVMRREENGESLIVQDSELNEDGKPRPPQLIFSADRIDIQVDPKTGALVFTVLNVYPAMGPDGKEQKLGFRHGIFMLDPSKGMEAMLMPIAMNPNDEAAFTNATPSPDGSTMLFTVGKYLGEGAVEVQALVSCPLTPNGAQSSTPLVQGRVSYPSFSPDSQKIVYVMSQGGEQAIFVAGKDGSNPKNLTAGKGDFAQPRFSPQLSGQK
ncbi:MAG TPA: hypothetical protein VK171_09300 [Fimbriimonas sp.]|nr:hypothetical protein [Fimbriimonas sp.]